MDGVEQLCPLWRQEVHIVSIGCVPLALVILLLYSTFGHSNDDRTKHVTKVGPAGLLLVLIRVVLAVFGWPVQSWAYVQVTQAPTANVWREKWMRKTELEGSPVGFLTLGYILRACQVIYLRCTADIVEDSEMQGRWPPLLHKLQEALRTGDKWPERPWRVATSKCNSMPYMVQRGRLRSPGELRKRKSFLHLFKLCLSFSLEHCCFPLWHANQATKSFIPK